MSNSKEIKTVTLPSGMTVLAKEDGTTPLTYGNRAQATKKCESLPSKLDEDTYLQSYVEDAPKGRFYVSIVKVIKLVPPAMAERYKKSVKACSDLGVAMCKLNDSLERSRQRIQNHRLGYISGASPSTYVNPRNRHNHTHQPSSKNFKAKRI